MKGSVRAGLIAATAWALAAVVIVAGLSVCSSCGAEAGTTTRVNSCR